MTDTNHYVPAKRVQWALGLGALVLSAAGLFWWVPGSGVSGSGSHAKDLLNKRGCDVQITGPAAPLGVLALRSGDSLTVALTGSATRCPSMTVTVSSFAPGADAGALADYVTTSAAGLWSYSITVPDHARTTVVAEMTVVATGKTTSTSLVVDADTRLPKLTIAAPKPNDLGKLWVVAPASDAGCGSGGNSHADLGEPGYVYDKACAAGGQVAPDITVTGGCTQYDGGCAAGTLTATYGPVSLASVAITTSPQHFTSAQLGTWTLDDYTQDILQVTATSPAGSTTRSMETTVQTAIPTALTSSVTVINARHIDVDVSVVLPTVSIPVRNARIGWSYITDTSLCYWWTGWDGKGGAPSTSACPYQQTYDAGVTPPQVPRAAFESTIWAHHYEMCWLPDPTATPQVWHCHDGSTHVAGETYVQHFLGLCCLFNTFHMTLTEEW